MNRCIYCDVNVKCCAIICRGVAGDVTRGSQSATAMWMFVYTIKNWHVWACRFATQSVTSWGIGGVFAYRVKTRHPLSPQLERCGDQRKVVKRQLLLLFYSLPQSTRQDVIGRRGRTCPRNEWLRILWRKRKVLHHHLSWHHSWWNCDRLRLVGDSDVDVCLSD